MFNSERIEKALNAKYFIENPSDFDTDLKIKRSQQFFYLSNITKFIQLYPEISKQYYDEIKRVYSIPYAIFSEYFINPQ